MRVTLICVYKHKYLEQRNRISLSKWQWKFLLYMTSQDQIVGYIYNTWHEFLPILWTVSIVRQLFISPQDESAVTESLGISCHAS